MQGNYQSTADAGLDSSAHHAMGLEALRKIGGRRLRTSALWSSLALHSSAFTSERLPRCRKSTPRLELRSRPVCSGATANCFMSCTTEMSSQMGHCLLQVEQLSL